MSIGLGERKKVARGEHPIVDLPFPQKPRLEEGTNQIHSIVDYKTIVPITFRDGGRNTYTTTKADTTEKHLGCEVVAVIYGNF